VIKQISTFDPDIDPSMLEKLDEAKAEMGRIPWIQVNKTLPSNTKCVILYVVDN
jgi:hypothetical protein